jgi:hypothetical protein
VATQNGGMGCLATDGAYVAWSLAGTNGAGSAVYDVPVQGVAGGRYPQLLTGGSVGAIAVGDGNVAWVTGAQNGSSILSWAAEGSTTTTSSGPLSTGGSPFALALNTEAVYLADNGTSSTSFNFYGCTAPRSQINIGCVHAATVANGPGPAAFFLSSNDEVNLIVGTACEQTGPPALRRTPVMRLRALCAVDGLERGERDRS